jgi:mannose-6-phosphate isomerase-like protein (cupin superfamily)
MDTGKIVSVKNAEHYVWGKNSDGWYLLKNEDLSVIEELMEPGASEHPHFHKKAQQLFYILSGEAGFELGQELVHLGAGETVHVLPGIPHKIFNNGDTDLRFIVISSPQSHGDRVEVEG